MSCQSCGKVADSGLQVMEPQPKKKQALRNLLAKGIVVDRISSSLEAPADEEVIERQLGFRPSNVVSVAARDRTGDASVFLEQIVRIYTYR